MQPHEIRGVDRNRFYLSSSTDPIHLRPQVGRAACYFTFNLHFRIIDLAAGQHIAIIDTRWEYTILDSNEHEILAYHWHPDGLSNVRTPHFHVGSAILDTQVHELGRTFSKMHMPTGEITIADVVRALIEEFGVVPIHARWDDVLRECQAVITSRHNPS